MDGYHYIREKHSMKHVFCITVYAILDDCCHIEPALVSELVSTRLAEHSRTRVALEAASDDRTASDSVVGRGVEASTRVTSRRTSEVAGAGV